MSDGTETVQDIVEWLLLLSQSQRLIEHAQGGYAGWYANESNEMPYGPEEVHMIFGDKPSTFSRGVMCN